MGELLHKEGLVNIETKAQQGLLPPNPVVPSMDAMLGQGDDESGAPRDREDGRPQAPEVQEEAQ
jgi:hypothetical protein